MLPGAFTKNADFSLPTERIKRALVEAAGRDQVRFVDATRLATALLGNRHWRKTCFCSATPISSPHCRSRAEAILNRARTQWRGGRSEPDGIHLGPPRGGLIPAVEALRSRSEPGTDARQLSASLDERSSGVSLSSRPIRTTYAKRYRDLVKAAWRRSGRRRCPAREELSEAVARYLFKLMAYKDEYEVARLYTDGSFAKQVAASFER
jgi:indolepyruvate ferredoxin oxidoreductase